ncbi:MAG: PTS sugar transporter subunit IIA [Planctomycetota bacterium]|nr:PTS sugar transporter subunit IIA [Planctomycetota bacterium]MDA1104969.1 PTS sugar transporter subunit IIA [Planctomycetota bacterium]
MTSSATHGGGRTRTAAMQLSSILIQRAVIVPLQSSKRDDAIQELASALAAAGACTDAEAADAVKFALKRERRGSTGFGHGIAVPHARLPWDKSPIAAFGLTVAGIDFKSLDREPVRGVFFMVTPEPKPDLHVEAMELIFSAFGHAQFRRFLLSATSPTAVTDLVAEYEAGAIAMS